MWWNKLFNWMKQFMFLFGLLWICALTLLDKTETVANTGQWLKAHYGPEVVIIVIFYISGLMLNTAQMKSGLLDVKAIVIALVLIFFISPIIAGFFGLMPLDAGIKIGIFLVAVMPSTLSSGVVMTEAAGGNTAQSLAITVIANWLCIFTIPIILSLLLIQVDSRAEIRIEKLNMMINIGILLLLPLCAGLATNRYTKFSFDRYARGLNTVNQFFVLCIVWMALSPTRRVIIESGGMIGTVSFLTVMFHAILLGVAGLFIKFFRLERGRRESVIFMGCQKTLPLSVILQVSLFPMVGLALMVCVVHHVVHLLMDAVLVGKLRER